MNWQDTYCRCPHVAQAPFQLTPRSLVLSLTLLLSVNIFGSANYTNSFQKLFGCGSCLWCLLQWKHFHTWGKMGKVFDLAKLLSCCKTLLGCRIVNLSLRLALTLDRSLHFGETQWWCSSVLDVILVSVLIRPLVAQSTIKLLAWCVPCLHQTKMEMFPLN